MTRLLALAALASVPAALVVILFGGGFAPAEADRAIVAPPRYTMLVEHAGLPERAEVRRTVARAVRRERRRNEASALRERTAEVRRAVARTEVAVREEQRRSGRAR